MPPWPSPYLLVDVTGLWAYALNKGALKGCPGVVVPLIRGQQTHSSWGLDSGCRLCSHSCSDPVSLNLLPLAPLLPVMCPLWEVAPQVDIQGPKSRHWGGFPHRWYGVST